MNHVEIVREFLSDRRGEELVADSFPFVTISREAGAGGRSLAAEVVKRMRTQYPGAFGEGWEMFDQNLCDLIAEDPHLGSSVEQLLNEEYRSEITQAVADLIAQRSQRYAAYKRVFEIIRILATLGKCVIVGRAGMCVCADMPLGVHIRLVAPPERRVQRMRRLLGVGESEAREVMNRQDADRQRLVRDFFDRNAADPLLYDAVYNTEKYPIELIADAVVRLAYEKISRFKSGQKIRSENST
jgi:cytidylate kinase